MTFAWPAALAALALGAPALVVAYLALLRRRARRAAELAAQGFSPSPSAQRMRRRRHVPYVVFLLGLLTLLLSLARPSAKVRVPTREGTVILAFDVSNSMLATDLAPTRIEAAKAAARTFVAKQPAAVKIGVVAFSDGGLQTNPATADRKEVLAAIDRLKPSGATSLGRGLFTALSAIAGKPLVLSTPTDTAGGAGGATDNGVGPGSARIDPSTGDPDQQRSLTDADLGFHSSAVIVLFSDGENTTQPDPLEVASLASTAGVKVYPVGIGSPDGTVVEIDGFKLATKLDEATLQEIAKRTGGTYYAASDAQTLHDVYKSVKLEVKTTSRSTELTGPLAAAGALLLALGAAASLGWFGRMV